MADVPKDFAILDKRLKSHLAKGEYADADRVSQELLRVAESAHPDDLPEIDLAERSAVIPASREEIAVDREHLRLLGTFYYVYGGLAAVVFIIPAILLVVNLASVGLTAGLEAHVGAGLPLMMLVSALFSGARVTGAVYAGRALKQGNHARFIWLVAWLNLLDFFFGTLLSICTMIVMHRPSVKALFAESESDLKRIGR